MLIHSSCDREDVRVMYVGQNGYVICIAAFGADAQNVSDTIPAGLVDVVGVHPRAGQNGILYWDKNTQVVKRLQTHDAGALVFPYDVSAVNDDLATRQYVQQCVLGHFAALVFYVQSVEDKVTDSNGDPYALVHGIDMDGVATGALFFWRWEPGEIETGYIYIARVLKVAPETYWNNDQWKYTPRDDNSKTLQCCWRTALEDVTEVLDIAQYFS